MAHCSFANFRVNLVEQREAFVAAQALSAKYRNGEVNRGFVLWGDVGRGKTHLLVAAVRHLALERGVRCRFVEFSHLLSALKARFDKGGGAAGLIDELVAVEVLAIDELGKGLLTEWELTVVDEIVSRRYNAARTILATTNYTPGPPTGNARPNLADGRSEVQPSLSDRVGERVYSRLIEMCDLRRVGGKDWRTTPQSRW
jgi:DNA replication protein DnaC